MQEFFSQNLIPRLENLEREIGNLNRHFKERPEITIELKSYDTEALIEDLTKLYQNFGQTTNLKINVTLERIV